MSINRFIKFLIVLMLLPFLLTSCYKDESSSNNSTIQKTIAVILPMQNGLGEHWKRSSQLYLDEYKRAQMGREPQIDINIEFYDEDKKTSRHLFPTFVTEKTSRPL